MLTPEQIATQARAAFDDMKSLRGASVENSMYAIDKLKENGMGLENLNEPGDKNPKSPEQLKAEIAARRKDAYIKGARELFASLGTASNPDNDKGIMEAYFRHAGAGLGAEVLDPSGKTLRTDMEKEINNRVTAAKIENAISELKLIEKSDPSRIATSERIISGDLAQLGDKFVLNSGNDTAKTRADLLAVLNSQLEKLPKPNFEVKSERDHWVDHPDAVGAAKGMAQKGGPS